MMFGYEISGVDWLWALWALALVVTAVVIAIVLGRAWNGARPPGAGHDEVEGILDARLARGEIAEDEHQRMRMTIGRSAQPVMRQRLAAGGLVLAIVAVLALATLAGGSAGRGLSAPWTWMSGHGMMGAWFGGGTGPPVSGDEVAMAGGAFSPANLVVHVRTPVTWTNRDSVAHTASAADGSWSSGVIQPGATYSRTFTIAGVQGYVCFAHPWMRASLTIQG